MHRSCPCEGNNLSGDTVGSYDIKTAYAGGGGGGGGGEGEIDGKMRHRRGISSEREREEEEERDGDRFILKLYRHLYGH